MQKSSIGDEFDYSIMLQDKLAVNFNSDSNDLIIQRKELFRKFRNHLNTGVQKGSYNDKMGDYYK